MNKELFKLLVTKEKVDKWVEVVSNILFLLSAIMYVIAFVVDASDKALITIALGVILTFGLTIAIELKKGFKK